MNFFIGSGRLIQWNKLYRLFLFCGLTAYDMQKIKVIHQSSYEP